MCVIGLFCNSSMSPSGDRARGVETLCWINAGVNNAEITLTHHTTALPPPVTGHSPVTAQQSLRKIRMVQILKFTDCKKITKPRYYLLCCLLNISFTIFCGDFIHIIYNIIFFNEKISYIQRIDLNTFRTSMKVSETFDIFWVIYSFERSILDTSCM